ncbi:glycosyltransferase [Leptolyngbya sp. AN03gr2]|uniref:glycosyltransferase family 2 protein n=1 Tax=unclassified Leptolyngbya TaxID=2650499 RepID=UPI003D31FD2D
MTSPKPSFPRGRLPSPPAATLMLLSVVMLSGAIVLAWFAGQGTISRIFERLNRLQENPPMWIDAPMQLGNYFLFWTVLLLLSIVLITKVSPRPQAWSRIVVVGTLLVLLLRYLVWRSLTTLNLSSPLNGVFSLGLFALELLMLVSSLIQLVLLLRVRDRRSEADQRSIAVINGTFTPSIDILIPTYNEPTFILRRTIIGCQALHYPNKRVYLLDDTCRSQVKELAAELGCNYITRSDNRHAKAGNLNNALTQTNGELIVVFDADFIPTKNFLIRTVGFFQNPNVALVQTPQTFYNPDPISYNLGLEDVLTPEEEVFYRQIQPIRDAAGGVVCSGTSFVVRRSSLQATGNFFTESLSEDYFTGIRLAASGYELVYLNEKLSAGLAAENIASQALQRIRWAQGTLQAFFIQANPLTISGLRPIQRLAHLEGLLHWFTSLSRLGFLLVPPAYAFLHVIPVRANMEETLFYFVPYYVAQITTASWLNHRSRSALLADLYSLVLCFPLAVTVIQTLLKPFSKGFKVTPKGKKSDRFVFNWQLAIPLIVLFCISALSLWMSLGVYTMTGMADASTHPHTIEQFKGYGLGLFWAGYNLVMLGIALLVLIDAPRPSQYEWFQLHRTVRLTVNQQEYWGSTIALSEAGAEVVITQNAFLDAQQVEIELMEERLKIKGTATLIDRDSLKFLITFEPLILKQHRCLVELLFCRPGQWKSRSTPGELRSLWLLIRIFLKPRILVDRHRRIHAIAVSQS